LHEVDIIVTQPYFLRTIKKAKKYHKKVILESEIDFPKYHWDIMKSRNKINNIPRRQWPSPNFYPYLARAVKSIEIADKIIVFGSHPFRTFVDAGVKQDKLIKLIPPTSVISTNTPNTFSKFPVFVYIGNHGLRKGIDILFKSWEKYKFLGGNAELLIYGKPNKSDSKYRNLLIELPGVFDQGYVEIEELLDETYKILISISFSEGFPRTVVEFLSAGQLVIANQPGGSELVKSGINGWQSSTDVAELVNTLFEVEKWWEKAKDNDDFKVDRREHPGNNFFSEVVKEIDQLVASQK
jgi:glycosyltransferase involved in cell wall biosynthesis